MNNIEHIAYKEDIENLTEEQFWQYWVSLGIVIKNKYCKCKTIDFDEHVKELRKEEVKTKKRIRKKRDKYRDRIHKNCVDCGVDIYPSKQAIESGRGLRCITCSNWLIRKNTELKRLEKLNKQNTIETSKSGYVLAKCVDCGKSRYVKKTLVEEGKSQRCPACTNKYIWQKRNERRNKILNELEDKIAKQNNKAHGSLGCDKGLCRDCKEIFNCEHYIQSDISSTLVGVNK